MSNKIGNKIRCPICRDKIRDNVNLVLYYAPDKEPFTCCEICYDNIFKAHKRLVRNMQWEAEQNRKIKNETNRLQEIAKGESETQGSSSGKN